MKIDITTLTDFEISQLSPRISVTSKLDGIKSWSLMAGDTCPGSYDSNGNVVEVCKACYAKGGNYRFKNVKTAREINKLAWKNDDFESLMIKALQDSRYFRWFDSGDMYSLKLAKKIYNIMVATPWVNHWIPTKMYKFKKFHDILNQMNDLPNVSIRFSADSLIGETLNKDYPQFNNSTVIESLNDVPNNVFPCLAYTFDDNACNGCRECWNKNTRTIAYVAHGQKAKSIYKHIKIVQE